MNDLKKNTDIKIIYYFPALLWIITILSFCFFISFSDVLNSFTTDGSLLREIIDLYDFEYKFIWSLFYSLWFKCLLLVLLVRFYLTFKTKNIKKLSDGLTNSLTKILFNKISLIIGFSSLLLVLISFFTTDSYLITDHFHDLFIPINGAYALKHGLILHKDIYTPFGFIYNTLNYFSLLIIESFPGIFDIFDTVMLSSVLFSIIIISLFFLIKTNMKRTDSALWFILVFILSICFQGRNMADFNGQELRWSGTYNHHLWTLLMLQVTHLFLGEKYLFRKQSYSMKNKIYFFTLIQTLCVFISFNYKFNFFLSSLLLFCSMFLLMPSKLRLKNLTMSVFLFLFSIVCTAFFFNYPVFGYLTDIHHAITAKKGFYVTIKDLFSFMILFFFIRNHNSFCVSDSNKDISSFTKKTFQKSIFFIKENKAILTRQIIFDFFTGLSILVGIEGDYQKPLIYLLVIPALWTILNKQSFLKIFLFSLLTIIFSVNIFSLSRSLIIDLYKDNQLEKLEKKSKFFFRENLKRIDLKTKNKNYSFTLKERDWLVYEEKSYLDSGTDDKIKFFSELSYKESPDLFEFFSLIKEETKALSSGSRFLLKIMGFPLYSSKIFKKNFNIPFSITETQYIKQLNSILDFFVELNPDKKDVIFNLDFVSPIPVLLNMEPMKPSHQWIHFSTSLHWKNIHRINFKNADFIFLPHLTFGLTLQNAFMKCHFYRWNFENKKFILISADQYGLLFTTKEKLEKYNLKTIPPLNEKEVKKACIKSNLFLSD